MTGGTGVDLSGISLPFSVADMVGTGMQLVGLIGSFVLLALAFAFVPKFIGMIRGAWTNSRGRA